MPDEIGGVADPSIMTYNQGKIVTRLGFSVSTKTLLVECLILSGELIALQLLPLLNSVLIFELLPMRDMGFDNLVFFDLESD